VTGGTAECQADTGWGPSATTAMVAANLFETEDKFLTTGLFRAHAHVLSQINFLCEMNIIGTLIPCPLLCSTENMPMDSVGPLL
jgi:hypothetical protein